MISLRVSAFIGGYSSGNTWNIQLTDKINHVLRVKPDITTNVVYDFDVAIITALLIPELKSVLNLDCNRKEHHISNDSTTYHIGVINKNGRDVKIVAAAANQMGMTASAVLTTKLNIFFKPRHIIMSGITAGIPGETNIGDVLIADSTWDYGSGKIEKIGRKIKLSPDIKQIPLDTELKGLVSSVIIGNKFVADIKQSWPGDAPDTSIRIHLGPVVSGSAVVKTSDIVKTVQDQGKKIIGIEMETYAVYFAAFNGVIPRPQAISIKVVCDYADDNKNSKWQKYCAFVSANFVYNFIAEYL